MDGTAYAIAYRVLYDSIKAKEQEESNKKIIIVVKETKL